jgi:hypothetical protein
MSEEHQSRKAPGGMYNNLSFSSVALQPTTNAIPSIVTASPQKKIPSNRRSKKRKKVKANQYTHRKKQTKQTDGTDIGT